MEFLFFLGGAILVLVSVIVGYAMGERKSDREAANKIIGRGQ